MFFSLKLNLNSNQKIQLYKVGQATKVIYNTALELLAINYVDNNKLYTSDELYKLVEFRAKSLGEVKNYKFSIFTPVIRLAQFNYNMFLNKKGMKPYKKEVNEFDFTIYLDKEDIIIKKDSIILTNKLFVPDIQNEKDYVLNSLNLVGIQGAKDYKNFKIHYDGSNYYFQGERIPFKKNKTYGLVLYFNNKSFISSTDGININKITDDESFINNCLMLLDLQETHEKRGTLTEAEKKSYNFIKKHVNNVIDGFIENSINQILEKEPQFICINETNSQNLGNDLKDKINKYIAKILRNHLFKKCMNLNIDYFVMPAKQKITIPKSPVYL